MTEPSRSGPAGSEGEGRPASGAQVSTACGGWVIYTPETPWALFRGEVVYFCLAACKEDYERDPRTSCLAHRFLSK